jgi:hypothetical protein
MVRPIDGRTCFLAISLLLLNIFDAYASLYFIHHSTIEVEVNPFSAWLMRHGTNTFVSGKIAIAAFIALVLAARIHLRHVRPVLYFAFGFYTLNALFLSGSFVLIHMFYGGVE